MTDLRTAAQQALEALEWLTSAEPGDEPPINAAITALRAALAQKQAEPVQEPVAWIQPDHLQKARVAPFLCRVEPTQRCPDFVAIYTAPPQRKPLTDEEIKDCFHAARNAKLGASKDNSKHRLSVVEIARAIERAHGIGVQS